jgi:pSer/pThr/pTyr-binding forkhead associated (FHA) protein
VGRTPSLRLVHQRSGEQFAVSGYTIVIGRDAAAQVVIRADDERHVSGRHLEIQFRTDHTVVVRDLGSRNGSWLNDKPLKGEAPLKVGDRLLLGNAPTVLTVAALDG